MNNLFDRVYIINREDRKDRLQRTMQECMAIGLTNVQVFPAIIKENGAEGLFYTMHAIFEKCHEDEIDNVLILEDDVKFVSYPKAILKWAIDFFKTKEIYWDILHLGPNCSDRFQSKVTDANYLLPLQNGLATHAVAYSAPCMRSFLDLDLVWEGKPIDVLLAEHIQSKGNSYCTYPLLATQHDDYSDIEKIHTSYTHIQHKFYKFVEPLMVDVFCNCGENYYPRSDDHGSSAVCLNCNKYPLVVA